MGQQTVRGQASQLQTQLQQASLLVRQQQQQLQQAKQQLQQAKQQVHTAHQGQKAAQQQAQQAQQQAQRAAMAVAMGGGGGGGGDAAEMARLQDRLRQAEERERREADRSRQVCHLLWATCACQHDPSAPHPFLSLWRTHVLSLSVFTLSLSGVLSLFLCVLSFFLADLLSLSMVQLEGQLRVAQQELTAAKSQGGGQDTAELSRLQERLREAESRAQEAETRATAAAAGGNSKPASSDVGELQSQLADAERRGAELMTRNAVIEEELTNYQKYMKTNMSRYQREIVGLKKHVQWWKQKALDAGVPANTKAPS